MSKLKTLKDLENEYSTGNGEDAEIDLNAWEWSNIIRQNAYDWLEKTNRRITVKDWITFFNLKV